MRLLLFLLAASLGFSQDTVIVGARIADGTGAPLRAASVRIHDGSISQIGAVPPQPADRVISAKGLILAPGFIDPHNHSDRGLRTEPDAISQVSQGITTVLLGQDGGSALPIGKWMEEYRNKPTALNVATMAGHATLRTQVMGKDYKRFAKPEEVTAMAVLLEQAMKDGAYGLSSGLEYEVGSYSNTEEVIALSKTAARSKGFYISHVRDEANLAIESIRELVRIAEEAMIAAQITHIKLGAVAVWGKTPELIRIVEDARKRGLDITADCYPYDAWSSTITVLVPDKQYDNPKSVAQALADVGGGKNVTITNCKAHPDYEFQNLQQIAVKTNRTTVEVFIQVVKDGGASVVGKTIKEEDMRILYKQPWVMVSSDGGIGMRHPRGTGTYPRVLGRFVREQKIMPLEAAIHKMTGMPAQRLRLKDRGRIAAGYRADLVLFNPDTVQDNSTFKDPFTLSTGIEKVWVNGALVWSDGRTTGAHPGSVLTRP